jgi:protocatechuate 3,4-dioxygenase beta subunit
MRAALALALALAATAAVLLLRGSGSSDERAAAREALSSQPPAAPVAPATAPTPSRDDAAGIPAAGRVFDEAWQPVAGAVVETDEARTTTDADGRFALPAATRSAKVRARGFAAAHAYWPSAARPAEIQLFRGGSVAGTVRDAAGRPVPGAGVQSGGIEATADAEGRYALPDLPAGFLEAMEVRAPGRVWQNLARLPEAPVRAGATTEFDPVVATGVTVEGTAPPGAAVLLGRARTNADAQGRFRYEGVLPGRHWIRLDPGLMREIHVGASGLANLVLADPLRATLLVTGAGRAATLLIAGNTWLADPGPDGSLAFGEVLATPHASLQVGATSYPLALPANETTMFAIPPPDFVLAGVVEGPDGRALAGAEVWVGDEAAELCNVRPDRWNAATTDGAGRFRIEVRSSGRSFALVASHPDFTPGVLRRIEASSDGLVLRLGQGVTIEGTVSYDTGEPASRAWIMAHDEDPRFDFSSAHSYDQTLGDALDVAPPLESRVARSDEAGRFRIEGIVPGTYWIHGDEVEVGAGGATIHVTLVRAERAALSGIVVDLRGARVAGAVVVAGEASCWTDNAGRFRLDGLEALAHDVLVKPQQGGLRGGPFFPETTVRGVAVPSDDIVVRVGDGRTLRGRILDAAGAPIAGASVTVLPPPPEEQGVRIVNRPNTPCATTDADGWYEVRGLSDGPVELAAFRDGHLPVVFEAKGDLADEQRLQPGQSIDGVLLDASGAPAEGRSLRCKLERPASPAEVLPWRRNWDPYEPWLDTTTGRDGSFRITGLPSGEYEIELGEMAPVRVTSGSTGLKLRLLPLRTITGIVVDEHGRPVCRSGHQRLKISAHHASGQVGYISLAEDGSFRFDRVPEGRIRLHVIGWEDFESKQLNVEAGAQDVRVQLAPSPPRER